MALGQLGGAISMISAEFKHARSPHLSTGRRPSLESEIRFPNSPTRRTAEIAPLGCLVRAQPPLRSG